MIIFCLVRPKIQITCKTKMTPPKWHTGNVALYSLANFKQICEKSWWVDYFLSQFMLQCDKGKEFVCRHYDRLFGLGKLLISLIFQICVVTVLDRENNILYISWMILYNIITLC